MVGSSNNARSLILRSLRVSNSLAHGTRRRKEGQCAIHSGKMASQPTSPGGRPAAAAGSTKSALVQEGNNLRDEPAKGTAPAPDQGDATAGPHPTACAGGKRKWLGSEFNRYRVLLHPGIYHSFQDRNRVLPVPACHCKHAVKHFSAFTKSSWLLRSDSTLQP